jgi:hypothetical protein
MNWDNVMTIIILSGFALCGVYFRIQFTDWRTRQNAEMQERIRVRLLYSADLSHPSERDFLDR